MYCGCVDPRTGEAAESKWFRAAWAKAGKKFDMGKVCVRFRIIDDVALDVVAQAITHVPVKEYIKRYLNGVAGVTGVADAKNSQLKQRCILQWLPRRICCQPVITSPAPPPIPATNPY